MHVLFLVFFNSPVGGLQENIYSTVSYLKKQGGKATVVCKNGSFSDRLRAIGVDVICTDFLITSFNDTLREVLVANLKDEINLVHCHPFVSRRLGVIVSRILGIPCVLTMHGRYTDELKGNFQNLDSIFLVSEGVKQYVLNKTGLSSEKMHVIPNAVDQSVFCNLKLRERNVSVLNFSLVTRIDLDKKFILNTFNQAVRYISENFSQPVVWNIIGDGRLRDDFLNELKNLVGTNQVVYKGWLEGAQLNEQYNRSDVVIGPGRCALEAMSSGAPTIALGSATYCGLIGPNTWQQGVFSNFGGVGAEFDEDISQRLGSDLSILMQSHETRRIYGKFAQKIIEIFFQDNRCQEKLLGFYEVICSGNIQREKVSHDEFVELGLGPVAVKWLSEGEVELEHNVSHDLSFLYEWRLEKDGAVINKIPFGPDKRAGFTVTDSGQYRIYCKVKAAGKKSVEFIGLEFRIP